MPCGVHVLHISKFLHFVQRHSLPVYARGSFSESYATSPYSHTRVHVSLNMFALWARIADENAPAGFDTSDFVNKLGRFYACMLSSLKLAYSWRQATDDAAAFTEALASIPETTMGAFAPRGIVGVVRCINRSLCNAADPHAYINTLTQTSSANFAHGEETTHIFLNINIHQ